jgi:ribosomal protein S18 acetylase RimI-like enzyme
MTDNISIRPALAADSDIAAYLIHLSMKALADYLFGQNDSFEARRILTTLFAQKSNRFSYQFADIAEAGDRPAGLLISYPGRDMNSLEIPMGRQILKAFGLARAFRFIRNALPLIPVKEAETDEFFINNVAVLPKFQGQGIGTRLLAHAEKKAKAANLGKCSLSVEIGNEPASRLYRHLGYQVIETFEIDQLKRRIGFDGFHRMVKILS